MTIAVCAGVCLHPALAAAQGRTLTLAEVLARAREQAPRIVSARLALEEARGRLAGASVRSQSNPQIDWAVGTRDGADTRSTDFEVGYSHPLEPGARRQARVDGATAAIAQSTAAIGEVTREALRQAASAYYGAVFANDRIRLLNAAHDLASGVAGTADRRFKAGDIAVLDVNLTRVSLARVRADRDAAEAAKALALGELRQLLRLEGDLDVAGSLSTPDEAELNGALQAAVQRPDLRALEASVQEAEAEMRLGQSLAKPEYGLGVRYSREEGDNIVMGGMTITLPFYSKGQEQRAVGAARAARLRAELEAARANVTTEVRMLHEVYARRLAAVRGLQADAVPGLDENERLTARSFEAGQIGLPELLLIRRELLDTRMQYLDALLEATLARTDLDASAGILR